MVRVEAFVVGAAPVVPVVAKVSVQGGVYIIDGLVSREVKLVIWREVCTGTASGKVFYF